MRSPEKVLLVAAAGVGLASILSLTDSHPTNVGASPKDTPTPTPSSRLVMKEGMPSQRAYAQLVRETTSFQINDIKVAGSRAIMLASLPNPNPGSYAGSDWHMAVGDLNPTNSTTPLLFEEKPVNGYARTVAMSETNPDIMFWGGSTAPGSHQGIGSLSTDGGSTWQAYQIGSESISNSYVTPDNKYVIIVEGAEEFPGLPVYSKLDLANRNLIPMNNTCGLYSIPITTLKSTADNTYTGYGWSPSSGYEKITFNPDNTVSCQWLNKEGSQPDSFFRYTGTGNTDMLGLVRHIMDPSGNSALGKIDLLANEVLTGTMIVSRASYPEYTDDRIDIDAIGGAVDTTSNTLYMTTVAYPLYSMGRVLNVEYSPLTALGDLTQRKRLPQDGTWFAPGRVAGSRSVQTTNIFTAGNERYLGVLEYFVYADQASSGLNLRRITNGINSTDVWQRAVLQLAEATPTSTATATMTVSSTSTATTSPTRTETPTATSTATPTVVFRAFNLYLPMTVNQSYK